MEVVVAEGVRGTAGCAGHPQRAQRAVGAERLLLFHLRTWWCVVEVCGYVCTRVGHGYKHNIY